MQDQIRNFRTGLQRTEANGLVGQLFVGWWLAPAKFVADPFLGVAETVLPTVTQAIPFSDHVVGLGLGGLGHVGQWASGLGLVHEKRPPLPDDTIAEDAGREFQRFLRADATTVWTLVGFGISTAVDVLTAPFRMDKLSGWFTTFVDLNAFLKQSGIGTEARRNLLQLDTLTNMIVLHKAQARIRPTILNVAGRVQPTGEAMTEGYYYMKFATAAYGIASIRAANAQLQQLPQQREPLRRGALNALPPDMYNVNTPAEIATRRNISQHTGIPEDDITMFVRPGGDMNILRHFVAVDREKKAVVLCIRGTFSVSGTIIDIDGETVDFCGGQAHNGMAKQADDLWGVVGDIVTRKLGQCPGFQLILCGHSLGAGVACLLTIKCYAETLVPAMTKVRCFAYASPAVFTPLTAAPEAIANTIAFIHDDDCVPFLSVANIRELLESLEVVERNTEYNWWSKAQLAWRGREPSASLVAAIKQASVTRRENIVGAERSYVPAGKVVWMRGSHNDGYVAHVYNTAELPEIYVDKDMLTDHFPPFYEEALEQLSV